MTQTVTVTPASIADLIEQRDALLEALKKIRNAFVCAVAFNVDVQGFDPTEHVLVRAADAAIANASPIAGLTEIGGCDEL